MHKQLLFIQKQKMSKALSGGIQNISTSTVLSCFFYFFFISPLSIKTSPYQTDCAECTAGIAMTDNSERKIADLSFASIYFSLGYG